MSDTVPDTFPVPETTSGIEEIDSFQEIGLPCAIFPKNLEYFLIFQLYL
jgi:hypothetical protein